MSTFDQLKLRAYRILQDGLPHSTSAVNWAKALVNAETEAAVIPDQVQAPFCPRELSLGATFE